MLWPEGGRGGAERGNATKAMTQTSNRRVPLQVLYTCDIAMSNIVSVEAAVLTAYIAFVSK